MIPFVAGVLSGMALQKALSNAEEEQPIFEPVEMREVTEEYVNDMLAKSGKPVIDTYGRTNQGPIPFIRLDDDAIARWHDVPMGSEEHMRLLLPYNKVLADLGQKTITTTLIDEAWNQQTYDRFRSCVQATKRADGAWTYDYTLFDKIVENMEACCRFWHPQPIQVDRKSVV